MKEISGIICVGAYLSPDSYDSGFIYFGKLRRLIPDTFIEGSLNQHPDRFKEALLSSCYLINDDMSTFPL